MIELAIVIIRTLILYVTLMLIMRLLGKRQMGEMELSEFVLASMIADLAAHPLQDIGIPMLNGLVPILILFSCEMLIAGLSLKSIRLRELLFGRPSVLIRKGEIDQKEMHANRFTLDELLQELRSQGVTDLRSVESAILETNGRISLLQEASQSPVTPEQLGLSVQDRGQPLAVICDGRILKRNLAQLGLSEAWLRQQLQSSGIRSAGEVFLMTVDKAKEIYLCRKDEPR